MHPVFLTDEALKAQCKVERYRASGPGGQHRNKVETAIRLTHVETGVTVTGTERRSQADNLEEALWRMRLALAVAVREPAPPERGVSELWASRRGKDGRVAVNERHPDLPGLIAEAMDYLAAEGWQPGPAGERLGVTGSQLVKLLQKDSQAFATMNEERKKLGLGGLR